MVAGKPAAVQLLQPEEVQTLGDDVAAVHGRSEEDAVEAVLADGAQAQVRVGLRVPRVLAVLGPAQQLPHVRDVAGQPAALGDLEDRRSTRETQFAQVKQASSLRRPKSLTDLRVLQSWVAPRGSTRRGCQWLRQETGFAA